MAKSKSPIKTPTPSPPNVSEWPTIIVYLESLLSVPYKLTRGEQECCSRYLEDVTWANQHPWERRQCQRPGVEVRAKAETPVRELVGQMARIMLDELKSEAAAGVKEPKTPEEAYWTSERMNQRLESLVHGCMNFSSR